MGVIPIRPLRIEGNIAYVPLTRGYEAIIDAADAEFIGQWNWQAHIDTHNVYAVRKGQLGEIRRVIMHRSIMQPPSQMKVDHIDGNGLNNTRSNLRVVSHSDNLKNQQLRRDNRSGFKGVTWKKDNKKWCARIVHEGKRIHLGYFKTPEAAYEAYCQASQKLHGEFSRLR
jgi:hypothetical protein